MDLVYFFVLENGVKGITELPLKEEFDFYQKVQKNPLYRRNFYTYSE